MTGKLRGRQSIKLDPKGRIAIPSQFRTPGKEQKYFITNNLYRGQRHLDLFPEKEWLALEKRYARLPSLNSDVQAFRRFYLASAEPVRADAQGRLLIPQELRAYANLEEGRTEDVVLLGVGDKLEIWNAQAWKKFQNHVIENFDAILANVAKLEEDSES